MVILLLPASRASSTYASCKNQGIGSIVPAHDEEALGIETPGGAVDLAAGLADYHAAPGCIARGPGEQAQDRLGVERGAGGNGFEQFREKIVDGCRNPCVQPDRRGFDLRGKGCLVDVDADPGD